MTDPFSDGYLAPPPGGDGPPVLVLHAWWGLNDTIKEVCNRLAELGFVAFAPDLYHGRLATTIPEAEALGGALDERYAQAQAEVAAAARQLNETYGSGEGIGVVGFSLGAFYALDLSNALPDVVRAVAVFYGSGPDDFSRSGAAYLAHFAGDDPYEPDENAAYLQQALAEAGRPATIHRYPGTGHWFFEPDRPDAHDPAAAALAWERTVAFLEEELG
jgi:carboxymethylenebutenolidase